MDEVKLFEFQGNRVRTVLIGDEPYFVGNDAALAIGYANPRDAISKHVKGKYKRVSRITTPSGTQTMTVISEPGIYQLAGQSKLPSAEPFQDWIYERVLPSIRKTGAYVAPQTAADWLNNPDMMIQALERYKDAKEENQRLHDERRIMLPKARFADAVSDANNSILVREMAKLLKQNGVAMGEKRLYGWLRDNGYLIRSGSDYNRPTQRAMELRLFSIKETVIQHSDGRTMVKGTTKVTGKGQRYFIDKFLEKAQEA